MQVDRSKISPMMKQYFDTKEKLSDLKSECQEIVSDLQAVNSELAIWKIQENN